MNKASIVDAVHGVLGGTKVQAEQVVDKVFDSIVGGLKKATEKRDISPERLRAIVDDIEAELRNSGRAEIPSGEIGELVMDRLRVLDEVAYIRFASVYREFMDLQQVKKEIEAVLSNRPAKRTPAPIRQS